jgi:hypothetical protein
LSSLVREARRFGIQPIELNARKPDADLDRRAQIVDPSTKEGSGGSNADTSTTSIWDIGMKGNPLHSARWMRAESTERIESSSSVVSVTTRYNVLVVMITSAYHG